MFYLTIDYWKNVMWYFFFLAVHTLVLSDNAITKLPGQLLSNLASLSHLLLDRNLLENLPSSLFEANVSLTVLDLSHNRFSQIPEAVTQTLPDGALHQLQSLSLSGNLVDELGSFDMPSLWRLEVSDNKLQNLTGLNLAGMPGLQVNYIDYYGNTGCGVFKRRV